MSIAGGRGRSQLNKYRQIQIHDKYTMNIEVNNKKCTNTHKLSIEEWHNSCASSNLVTKRKKIDPFGCIQFTLCIEVY